MPKLFMRVNFDTNTELEKLAQIKNMVEELERLVRGLDILDCSISTESNEKMLNPLWQNPNTGVEAGINSRGDLYLIIKNENLRGGFNMPDTPQNRKKLKRLFDSAVADE